MPPWATVEADVDVVCRLHQRIADVYPVETLDIIVVGIFHQVWYGTEADHVGWSSGQGCGCWCRISGQHDVHLHKVGKNMPHELRCSGVRNMTGAALE